MEEARIDISLDEALESYIDDVLVDAPDEIVSVGSAEADEDQLAIGLVDDDELVSPSSADVAPSAWDAWDELL